MKTKKKVIIYALMVLAASGIIIWAFYSYRVRFIGKPDIGFIRKDESGKVEAYTFLTIYNGTLKDKKVFFDIDTRYEERYNEGALKDGMYNVTKIEITDGDGQVDTENMILNIQSGSEVQVTITAENTYVGEDYQGEEIYLRKAAPHTSFHIVE